MNQTPFRSFRRVLIASANPIFARGLERLFRQGDEQKDVEIVHASTMEETFDAMKSFKPEMVIVDHDDETIEKGEFLSRFVADDQQPMQVMLVSLKASGAVVVYDRQTLTSGQAEEWLINASPAPEKTPPPQRPASSLQKIKHFGIVGILIVVLTILMYLFFNTGGLLPVEASTQAATVDEMFQVHYFLISFLFSLIVVFIGYSIVVFRARPGENRSGAFFKSNNRLEIIWSLVPLATVIGLAYIGSQSLAETLRTDPDAMEVKVVGFQWGWTFEYPAFGVTTNKLYLPVNKQVLLKMTSKDVIHSFWVPEFRVKQDVLPGANLVKNLRITPTLTGQYKVLCAELCGGAHAYMEAPVVVVSQADFDAWINQEMGASVSDPVERGKKLSESNGCTACHTLDGKQSVGPTWKGLAGSQRELANGSTVSVDEAYLKESIINPGAKIVKGFQPNIMPATYASSLNDQQLSDIISFINSLK